MLNTEQMMLEDESDSVGIFSIKIAIQIFIYHILNLFNLMQIMTMILFFLNFVIRFHNLNSYIEGNIVCRTPTDMFIFNYFYYHCPESLETFKGNEVRNIKIELFITRLKSQPFKSNNRIITFVPLYLLIFLLLLNIRICFIIVFMGSLPLW